MVSSKLAPMVDPWMIPFGDGSNLYYRRSWIRFPNSESPRRMRVLLSSDKLPTQYVRSILRKAILNGELTSGSRLVQAELAAMLDVSTTPLREALRDLATEGPVQFDPHRGAIVTELSEDDLHDIYELRLVLEPLAMRQAVDKVSSALSSVCTDSTVACSTSPTQQSGSIETVSSIWLCT